MQVSLNSIQMKSKKFAYFSKAPCTYALSFDMFRNFVPYVVDIINSQRRHDFAALLNPVSNPNEPRHDKTNKVSERTAKTQISLGIRPV